MGKIQIVEALSGSYEAWDPVERHIRAMTGVPVPPDDLGRNLHSLDDARRWLLHPANWLATQMEIMKWDGLTPYLSRRGAERLLRSPEDVGLLEVAVVHQYHLRHKAKRGEDITEKDPQLEE